MTNTETLKFLCRALKNAQASLKKAVFEGNLGQAGYHANTIGQIQEELATLADEIAPPQITG